MNKKIGGKEIGETAFILVYLAFLLLFSIIFFIKKDYYFFIMTLILGIGDSFHLIPRIIKNIKGDFKKSSFWLGLGTQISSITMTVFYLLLIIMLEIYSANGETPYILNSVKGLNYLLNDIKELLKITNGISFGNIIMYLSIIRIAICLLPQNNWYRENGNEKWAIIRNIPFTLLGICAIVFAIQNSFTYIAILVAFSFIFYLPVALYGKKNKKLGMLMIPKTICYMLLIIYFLNIH